MNTCDTRFFFFRLQKSVMDGAIIDPLKVLRQRQAENVENGIFCQCNNKHLMRVKQCILFFVCENVLIYFDRESDNAII